MTPDTYRPHPCTLPAIPEFRRIHPISVFSYLKKAECRTLLITQKKTEKGLG